MVETTKLELPTNELKILLTALYSFEQLLEKKKTHSDILLSIYASEKLFNFDYELESLISNPIDFLDKVIGTQCDKLFEAFYDLAEKMAQLNLYHLKMNVLACKNF